MCVQAIPLILSAVGTGVQQNAENRAARERLRATEQAARSAEETNRQASARVGEEIQRLKPEAGGAGAAQNTLQNDFMAALRRANLTEGNSGLDGPAGNVSDTFSQDAATARGANAAGNRAAVGNITGIESPFLQRLREATSASRAVMDLSRLESRASGQDYLNRLRMSLISPNAGQQAAGEFMQGAGSALAQRTTPARKPRTVDSTIPGGA